MDTSNSNGHNTNGLLISQFSSMPNFRKLPSSSDLKLHDKEELNVKLYRSSRPDFLTPDEVDHFLRYGIRCIIDFRSAREYRKANGPKLLDATYPVYKVKLPSAYKHDERVQDVFLKGPAASSKQKHVLIDFFRLNYVWAVFRRAPWTVAVYSLFWLIVDLILGTHYKYFVRIFAKHVLNKEGLFGQYVDMLTYSQPSICAALKLLCDPGNVPAMLNCAHGKDRTGIVSALALSCVGLSKEAIAADYAQSEHGLEHIKGRVHKEIVGHFHMCTSFTTAHSETMMKVLNYIEESYGSVTDYLSFIGFSCKEQIQLRNNIVYESTT